MIVSQSLYCSEFVHRARCFPVGSPRTARRIGRMRARARSAASTWARSRGRSKRPLWGDHGPDANELDLYAVAAERRAGVARDRTARRAQAEHDRSYSVEPST